MWLRCRSPRLAVHATDDVLDGHPAPASRRLALLAIIVVLVLPWIRSLLPILAVNDPYSKPARWGVVLRSVFSWNGRARWPARLLDRTNCRGSRCADVLGHDRGDHLVAGIRAASTHPGLLVAAPSAAFGSVFSVRRLRFQTRSGCPKPGSARGDGATRSAPRAPTSPGRTSRLGAIVVPLADGHLLRGAGGRDRWRWFVGMAVDLAGDRRGPGGEPVHCRVSRT